MSNDGYVAPVNHGVLSATGNVVAGAVGGAAKGGIKTYLYTILACAGIAAAAAVAWPLMAAGGVTAGIASAVGSALGWGAAGGLVGAFIVAPFTSVFGSVWGAVKGGSSAHERTRMETGAANMMEAQVQVMRAQAMNPAVNDNTKYNFAAQGSAMNPASSRIQADSATTMGTLQSQQLARA